MHVRFISMLALTHIALGACAGSDSARSGDATWTTSRFKAGDTSVVRTENAEKASDVQLTRELAIGSVAGRPEYTFSTVAHVTPVSDGSVLFFDTGTRALRRFDSSGVYVHSVGRAGVGPGEFDAAYGIHATQDGKVLIESDSYFKLYGADGKSLGDRNALFDGSPLPGSTVALTADGFLHVQRMVPDMRYPDSTTSGGFRLMSYVVHRMKFDGDPVDMVYAPQPDMVQPLYEFRRSRSDDIYRSAIPLVPTFITAYSSMGHWLSGSSDGSYRILLRKRDSGLVRIESDLARISASQAERESLLYEMAYKLFGADPAGGPGIERVPKIKPAFKSLRTDVDGRIWVGLHQPGKLVHVDTNAAPRSGALSKIGIMMPDFGPLMRRQTERWVEADVYDVFAPDGEFLGRVRLPENSAFGNAIGNKLWLVVWDDMYVETVVRYRMDLGTAKANAAPR